MSFLYSGHLTLVVSVQLLFIFLKSHRCHRTPTGQPNFKSYTLGAEYPTNKLLLIQSMSSAVEATFVRFFHVFKIFALSALRIMSAQADTPLARHAVWRKRDLRDESKKRRKRPLAYVSFSEKLFHTFHN